MSDKKQIYLIFLLILTFIEKSLASNFFIQVTNASDRTYSSLDIIIYPVYFNANRGQIKISNILPHSSVKYEVEEGTTTIPLSFIGERPSANSNLDLLVVAAPKIGCLKSKQMESILKKPILRKVSKGYGLQVPNMNIYIDAVGDIKVDF